MFKLNTRFVAIITLIMLLVSLSIPFWNWWSTRSEISIDQKTTTIFQEPVDEELKILYGGKLINSLTKAIFVIENSGSLPIDKEDIKSPITIKINNAEILRASVSRVSPPNLEVKISNDIHNIKIEFPLLNPGEEIEIDVLADGDAQSYQASARITNISSITTSSEKEKKEFFEKISKLIGMIFMTFYMAICFLGTYQSSQELLRIKREKDKLVTSDGKLEAEFRGYIFPFIFYGTLSIVSIGAIYSFTKKLLLLF